MSESTATRMRGIFSHGPSGQVLRLLFPLLFLSLAATPDPADAQAHIPKGSAKEQTTPGFSGYVVNERPTQLHGTLRFTFWWKSRPGSPLRTYAQFTPYPKLIRDYRLVHPPGLQVTVDKVDIEEKPVKGPYDSQYVVNAHLTVLAPKDWPSGEQEILLYFPRIESGAIELLAEEPISTMKFTISIYDSVEAMAVGKAIGRWWLQVICALGFLLLITIALGRLENAVDRGKGNLAVKLLCVSLVAIGCAGFHSRVGLLVEGLWTGFGVLGLATILTVNVSHISLVSVMMEEEEASARRVRRWIVWLLVVSIVSALLALSLSFTWDRAHFYFPIIVYGLLASLPSMLICLAWPLKVVWLARQKRRT